MMNSNTPNKVSVQLVGVWKRQSIAINGEDTYEDDSVQTDEERLKHFLQEDHVRFYGLDIADRLQDAGFSVEVMDINQVPPKDVKRYGMEYPLTREIFLCRKS